MSPELSNTLNQLAQKLGTSVEKLWPILVERARLQATINLWLISLGIFAGFMMFGWSIHRVTRKEYDLIEDPIMPLSIISICLGLIFILCIPMELPRNVLDYKFPEVAALRGLVGK